MTGIEVVVMVGIGGLVRRRNARVDGLADLNSEGQNST